MSQNKPILADLVSNHFYEKLPLKEQNELRPSRICRVAFPYCYENREIWRPHSFDSTGTSATFFQPISAPSDAYKSQRILHSPRLEKHEEFPVVRAKWRPVVVLSEIMQPTNVRSAMRIDKKLIIVAPCYSVVDAEGNWKIPEDFARRVAQLEFPHLMFFPDLPAGGAAGAKSSLLRLDSITHVFQPHLERTEWCIHHDVWEIILGQIEQVLKTGGGKRYVDIRELLMKEI